MKVRYLILTAAALAAGTTVTLTAQQQIPASGTGADWDHHGGGNDEAGFSQLDQITTANVRRLGLASYLDLDGEVSLQATPLAVDGILYFTGSTNKVYAVDAVSSKVLWTYDPEVWRSRRTKLGMPYGVNRGAAYADGRIFVGLMDGRLISLDAKTGRLLWTVDTLPQGTFHSITGAPRTFNGKVIIGNAGADINGQRGFVTAYDQKTGQQAWRFYTVPGSPEQNRGDPVMEMAAKTWSGEWWKTGTGGTVWNGMTFDPELNRIYIGVGNAGPYNPAVRNPGGGDNLFVASIVALDADTGKYVWHYQENPNESWDYKAVANMISATIMIDGKPRKVLMQQPTNGFFYVLDRETGKLISAEKTGKVTWADHIDLATGRPVEAPGIRYQDNDSIQWPSMLGTHNWQDMSFSPRTGLVYIPHMKLAAKYTTHVPPGEFSMGGMTAMGMKIDPDDNTGSLLAWDPVHQRQAWSVPIDTIWNGGTLATAGGLVFMGAGNGWFSGYDAANGRKLWTFNAGLGINGAPISYMAHGKQYVSVLVGYGGTTAAMSQFLNVGWKYGAQPRRLLTFAIGGRTRLPASPPPDMHVYALDVPDMQLNEQEVQAGKGMSVMCGACHGMHFVGAGSPAPDLRESQIALNEDSLWQVVHEGVLEQRGMPAFTNLTRQQVHLLYVYLRAKAREALGKRPAEVETGGMRF